MIEVIPSLHRVTKSFKKNYFEQKAWAAGQVICGIDEVGRGCLAGPLVTAAVILPLGKVSPLLKDSKTMTADQREEAFAWIDTHCIYSIGIVHHRLIDQKNIWYATLTAMKKAVIHLLATTQLIPAHIVIDAMPLSLADTCYAHIPVSYFTQAERKSSSIAAASIVAKVKRDVLMTRFDTIFPGYNLAGHKGYSTPDHKKIVQEKNSLIIHRTSFLDYLDHQIAVESFINENQKYTGNLL